jgi:hypothetical protein
VADLFIAVFDAALSGNPPSEFEHGRSGFYFGENGEHKLLDVSRAIATILYESGRGKSPEPTTFTEEELKRFSLNGLGTNSRCRGDRSRAIGWKPTKVTADMLKSIRPEVEAMIRKQQPKQ